jgi:hypothetical protein
MRIDDSDTNREKSEAEWGGEVVQAPAAAISIERHHSPASCHNSMNPISIS